MTFSCGAEEPILNNSTIKEIQNIDMMISKNKIEYIINNLVIGKKYSYDKQKEFLKYILIGKWSNPPHVVYIFNEDQTCELTNYSTKENLKGKWRFSSDGIEINLKGKWENRSIKYFSLSKEPNRNNYYFNILFNHPVFGLTIDSDIAKFLDKN
jgi:hypothetical protein